MWIAAAEFFVWALLGLAAGFIGHWWKANANQYPDILDKDQPLLNMALTDYSAENYALDHRYTDAGYWDYYSLRNLFWYLSGGVGSTLILVYATAEGHAAARGAFCAAAKFITFTPVFCP
jgi:hypothetical protein